MRYLSIIAFTLLTFACTESEEKATQSIRSVVQGIIEADNRADISKVLSYYHSQAELVPPGKANIKGKQNIKENYESIFSNNRLELKVEIREIKISKTWAVVYGQNTGFRIQLDNQSKTEIEDPFVMLLEKENTEWKIRRLMWN